MVETGTFPLGIINAKGVACREFTLDERTFRHTLELANDKGINRDLLSNAAYYDAAVISKRLTVSGVDKLTPEMVLALDGEDGDILADKMMALDARRSEFRSTQRAPETAADSPVETGSAVD